MNQVDNVIKSKKCIEEYNIIRVIATLLVVIGHAGYISPMTNWGGNVR
jgi:peptidoglycan/LPS O-acetylase OafA/YrhL